jgi:hypothetical protein
LKEKIKRMKQKNKSNLRLKIKEILRQHTIRSINLVSSKKQRPTDKLSEAFLRPKKKILEHQLKGKTQY